jgi:hypothetical protein
MNNGFARLYLYIFEDQRSLLLKRGEKEKGIFSLAQKLSPKLLKC